MTKALFVASLTLFLFSCDESKNEPPKTDSVIRWEKRQKLDTLNQNEGINLSKKFDAITNKDSTIKFTYQLQEAVKNGKLISFTADINDIIQLDSNYLLKVYGRFAEQRCLGTLLVSTQQFHELSKQLDLTSLDNEGCFVFKPTSIKSSSLLTIDSEILKDEDAETVEAANANVSSELTYNFHNTLLFLKGSLIDFYLYKKFPEEE
jgi:hypothetical protein